MENVKYTKNIVENYNLKENIRKKKNGKGKELDFYDSCL